MGIITYQVAAIWPYFDEEEFSQAEDFRLSVLLVFDGLVECVAGMVAAGGTHNLKKRIKIRT